MIVTVSTRPIRPSSIAWRNAWNWASNRRLKPSIKRPFSAATTSRQRRTRAMSRSIGFSQKIGFLARANCSISGAWVSVGVAITTPSIAGSAAMASISATAAPCSWATASAASATASATTANRHPGTDAIARPVHFADAARP